MIPYEELAAALAGALARSAPKFVEQHTAIDQHLGQHPGQHHDVGGATLDDATMAGDGDATGEVDANDLLADEEA